MKFYLLLYLFFSFLFTKNVSAENLLDLKEIFCKHYQSSYFLSEEAQKFKIIKLFEEIENKKIDIDISEDMEIEIKKYTTEKIEIPWEYETIGFNAIKQKESKEIIPIDEGFQKRREKVKKPSIYLGKEYSFIHIKEKNFHKCLLARSVSKMHINFNMQFILFVKEDHLIEEDLKSKKVVFNVIGIKEERIIGYSILERKITIYGMFE